MKGTDYNTTVGSQSKAKTFIFIVIFAIARLTLIPNSLRVPLFRFCGTQIGDDVYLGSGIKLSDPASARFVQLGNRVAIADNCYFINSSGHERSRLRKYYPRIIGRISIGDDAYIGSNVTIFPSIRIHEMSVVGANSVVTRDVEAYSVVAGNPARVIKRLEPADGDPE